jgi:hypothetical protein
MNRPYAVVTQILRVSMRPWSGRIVADEVGLFSILKDQGPSLHAAWPDWL